MGVARLGFVATFLSDPLISGFTTGSAVFVVISQLKHILRTESSSDHWTTCFSEGNYAMSPLFFQTICRILGKEISKFEKITSSYSTKITVKSYPSEQLT